MQQNRLKNVVGGGVIGRLDFFDHIISPKNIFAAWREFKSDKMNKSDVIIFAQNVEENLFTLVHLLKNNTYNHSPYTSFYINDPKKRLINKAVVSDRVLHHAIHRVIEPIFEKKFVYDLYSSRKKKGTLKAIDRLEDFAWKLSRNNTRTVWILKCDIKKFFDSVDHAILLEIITHNIQDKKLVELLSNIINSYEKSSGKGIPLGNLTSQLFSNIYMNEFDQYIKRILRVKYYVRYADDFIISETNKENLELLLEKIKLFLYEKLKLNLHKEKIFIQKWHKGVDFLGYVLFPHHRVLRTKTKRRMLYKIEEKKKQLDREIILKEAYMQTTTSYKARLAHCRGRGLGKVICNDY